ncbi:hypothetical protein BO70DRAFT_44022 [Aspergillus heteromorphus CBS 117.55]|uniref:Zn(2)-C6 fungal-type domain-containing protein n=1 Tax=Aspergillus heteromorphus CBS 117.55 TaxID=1448321 RepID=A0A317WAG3_9EURO|nr:uncharacterized protein BO70DRAFT_44022 [Aspergillus heteromorphus CBS 117.55]PWY81988.1 hypothetical protein BO70DRAFT_44022 [Aspergillus heteromorphus CBS 117.55]
MVEIRRQRAFSHRSRTGCRTCQLNYYVCAHRARHVKCDEAPVACHNCTATGRRCDGYDQILPSAPKAKATSIAVALAMSLPGMSENERHHFQYFEKNTIPMLAAYGDSDVWQQLVLQMSQKEPAVCHAAVALSAIHGEYERKATGSRFISSHHRFALEQYNRAMSTIHERIQSNHPQVREIVLMCCIIFVIVELFEGAPKNAFTHLQQGLNILNNSRSGRVSKAETSLKTAFLHMNSHRANFDDPKVLVTLHPSRERLAEPPYERDKFHSLTDAKDRFRPLMCNIFNLRSRCTFVLRGDVDVDPLELSVQQCQLQRQIHDYREDFEKFVRSKCTRKRWGPREARNADVIRLYIATMTSVAATMLDPTEMLFDQYLSGFKRVNELVEQIMDSFKSQFGSLPVVIMDMGIVPALLWSCVKCRDLKTRKRSLQLLQAWPHREAIYDTTLCCMVSNAHITTENDAADNSGFVPMSARLTTQTIRITDDRSHIVFGYTLAGISKWGADTNERLFPLKM